LLLVSAFGTDPNYRLTIDAPPETVSRPSFIAIAPVPG